MALSLSFSPWRPNQHWLCTCSLLAQHFKTLNFALTDHTDPNALRFGCQGASCDVRPKHGADAAERSPFRLSLAVGRQDLEFRFYDVGVSGFRAGGIRLGTLCCHVAVRRLGSSLLGIWGCRTSLCELGMVAEVKTNYPGNPTPVIQAFER